MATTTQSKLKASVDNNLVVLVLCDNRSAGRKACTHSAACSPSAAASRRSVVASCAQQHTMITVSPTTRALLLQATKLANASSTFASSNNKEKDRPAASCLLRTCVRAQSGDPRRRATMICEHLHAANE